MDIASINEKIADHQKEHSMGMAAYFVLECLIAHLENDGTVDKSFIDNTVKTLAAAVQAEADSKSFTHERERWSAVAADITALSKRA